MNQKPMVIALAVGLLSQIAGAHPQSQAPTSIVGRFSGPFEGGDGTVEITGSAPRYHVHILVGADGCGGGVEGPASLDSKGRLVMVAKPAPAEEACQVTLTRSGSGWDVANEGNCGFYHGASCEFSGKVKPD